MSIALIAAMDRSHAIGVGNRLPWRLPAEMAYFTRSTIGKTVIMGRKTFESLPKPLKDRKNVILTRQLGYNIEGCETVHSVEESLERYSGDEIMVIGGAEIYEQYLPYADTLLLTDVDTDVEGADAFFPKVEEEVWQLVSSEHHEKDDKNAYSFTFKVYKRRNIE